MLNKLEVNEAIAKAKSPNILIDSGAAAHVFKHEDQFISWDSDFNPESVTIVMADGTPQKKGAKKKELDNDETSFGYW